MKKLLLVSSLVISTSLLAAPRNIPLSEQIKDFSVKEVSREEFMAFGDTPLPGPIPVPPTTGPTFPSPRTPERPKPDFNDRIETTGKVIRVARDLVALGESIYELVKKGKPTNITQYAAISVVPRDPISKEHADPFDLEGFSIPVEKNYIATVKNGSNKEVVTFAYKVIYSYGGSYDGKGMYLTNVMIVPSSVRTTFGWDFNATMSLVGIMNHGSKENPVAGAMIAIKYQMNSWSAAFERNDTIHISGNGEVKSFVGK